MYIIVIKHIGNVWIPLKTVDGKTLAFSTLAKADAFILKRELKNVLVLSNKDYTLDPN